MQVLVSNTFQFFPLVVVLFICKMVYLINSTTFLLLAKVFLVEIYNYLYKLVIIINMHS